MLETCCLGSSSSGNCYVFRFSDGRNSGKTHQIIVEAGFKYSEIQERAVKNGVKLSDSEACLVTHEHKDHSLGANALNDLGIKVFASKGTLDSIRIFATSNNTLIDWDAKLICPDITVLPFKVEHDAAEPFGFVINAFGENTLFINDCSLVRRDLSMIPISYAFLECNYEDQVTHIAFDTARRSGSLAMVKQYQRIFRSHMSLSGLVGTVKHPDGGLIDHLDLRYCQGLFLMHLSDRNSNEAKMKAVVKKKVGNIPVYVCRKYGGYE